MPRPRNAKHSANLSDAETIRTRPDGVSVLLHVPTGSLGVQNAGDTDSPAPLTYDVWRMLSPGDRRAVRKACRRLGRADVAHATCPPKMRRAESAA